MIVSGNVLGDLWDWVVGVFERIGDVSVYWLALALALKTAESAFIGLGWRNILRVAYPRSGLSFKTAWAASQGGTAINAVAPAQAGTVAMIGIFRTSIPGSSVAGVAAATAAQALFFTAVSVMMLIGVAVLLPRVVSKGSPSDETGGFFASHPVLIPAVVVAAIVILIVLWPRLKPWLREQWRKGKQGLAIFSDWRRYARRGGASVRRLVLLPHRRQRRLHGRLRHPRDRVHRRAGCLFAHALRALRDHTGWGWADAGARRCHARQTRSDRECRRIFGHARLGSDDVERCSRRRAHALGLRLRTDQAAVLEDTPEAGAGARLHLNESLPRSRRSPALARAVSSSEIDTGVSSPEDELVRAELDEARRKRRTGRARIVGTLVSVAVIGAVFAFALPRIADYGDVWDEIRKLSWQWLVVLGLATLLNLATYGPPLMAALPGLSYFHASRVTLASTALSVIAPGGAAVGMATTVAMLRACGFSGRPVGLAVVVMSVWNQSVILGFPILAVAGLAAQGARNRTLEIAALVGLAVFAVIVAGFAIALSSERLAHRVGDRAARLVSAAGRLLHKAPVKWNGASFVHFRDESIELIRRRWPFLTAATLAGHLTVFVVLVVSLRAVGVTHAEVTIVEAFAAWTLARILGAIPITPGGVGFVELGLTGVLVAFGASNAEAVAATMIYRFLTVVPTVVLGLVAAGTSVVGRKPGVVAQ